MDVEERKTRLAKAVVEKNIEEITRISIELESAENCDLKLVRASALEALGSFMMSADRELGSKYLREAIKIAEECDGDEGKRILTNSYGYLLMYDRSIAAEVIEKLGDDELSGPVKALAYALNGEPEKGFELIRKHLGTYRAALYGFIITTVIPPDKRPIDLLVDVVREAYRYTVHRGFENHYVYLLNRLSEQKLVGDQKAEVYALLAYALGPDKTYASQAFKAAKDEFIKDFTRIILAETIMNENPAMATRYAREVKPRDDPRGAYVTAVAKYILSRENVSALFEGMSYALKAYLAGLQRYKLTSLLVEHVLAHMAKTMAYIAYKLNNQNIAKALEMPCSLVYTFMDYKPMMAKACACAYKLLGKDYKDLLSMAEGYEDRLLDECLNR